VATLGAPLVLGAKGPELLAAARNLGMFRTPGYPPDPARWLAELAALDPLEAARDLGGRALLVVHGTDDTEVPVFEARALADAAEHVELRMLHGAGSQLRHDPRAIAVLVGWLERQAVAA
jgi:putative redox protein